MAFKAILQFTQHLISVSVLRQQATPHLVSSSCQCLSVLKCLKPWAHYGVSPWTKARSISLFSYLLKGLSHVQAFHPLSSSWPLPFPGKYYFPWQLSASLGWPCLIPSPTQLAPVMHVFVLILDCNFCWCSSNLTIKYTVSSQLSRCAHLKCKLQPTSCNKHNFLSFFFPLGWCRPHPQTKLTDSFTSHNTHVFVELLSFPSPSTPRFTKSYSLFTILHVTASLETVSSFIGE